MTQTQQVTRRQAFALVDLADSLVADLVSDHDLATVDRLHLMLDDAIDALGRMDGTARAANLAAQIIVVMTGPNPPKQG